MIVSDSSFKKDMFSMGIAMALGAMIAHSAGYLWFLGILSGGVLGYAVRMFTEPKRMKYAAKRAWQIASGVYEGLFINWQIRLIDSFRLGIAGGGLFSVLIGISFWFVSVMGEIALFPGINNLLIKYCAVLIFVNVIVVPMGMIMSYLFERTEKMAADFDLKWAARNLNVVAIHYHVVRLSLLGILNAIRTVPVACRFLWKFSKLFFRFVHSDDFTVCGMYGMGGAAMIYYFTVPNEPMLILVVACGAGVFGAIIRRLIPQYLLAEST